MKGFHIMAYAIPASQTGDREVMFHTNIHQSAADVARAAYTEKYGIDYHDDPEWEIGNERHTFWLNAFSERQKALILNPYQN
jgi:hypothetical protein